MLSAVLGVIAAPLTPGGSPSQALIANVTALQDAPNANQQYAQIRLDQCMPGLPENAGILSHLDEGALATTGDTARPYLATWLAIATKLSPDKCINKVAKDKDGSEDIDGGAIIVGDKYDFGFKTAAKVASNTVRYFMKCRFDVPLGSQGVTKADWPHITMWRDPKPRTVSGFYQILTHYLTFVRLPPETLHACIEKWPEDLDYLSHDKDIMKTGSHWGADCVTAWSTNAYNGKDLNQAMTVRLETLQETADSKLYNAVFDLPGGCWGIKYSGADTVPNDKLNPFCTKERNCDPAAPCVLSDQQMANLFAASLADVSASSTIGCRNVTFAAEHQTPIIEHVYTLEKVDALLKLETVDSETDGLATYIQDESGKTVPPAPDGCTFAEVSINAGADVHGLDENLEDPDRLKAIIDASPDLQQRICAMYWHDYVCGAYAPPEACKSDPSGWLEDAMSRLINGDPAQL